MSTAPAQYYKVLNPDGSTVAKGPRLWPMDGTWTQVYVNPQLCERGWHLAKREHLINFIGYGSEIWIAEPAPDAIVRETSDKVCVSQARLVEQLPWNEQSARLFAADCAEEALIYVNNEVTKATLAETIAVVRRFANGQATTEDLSAAWSAAGSAAWSAAGLPAGSAAGSPAWSAAWSAASAAGSPAWSAAWSAAESAAESAAWSAAWSAAESAARSAARSAAKSAQNTRLLTILGVK